ncbi:MAG: L-threonylcarbamoyladenylate synthase, partial [Eggerthella lenta]
MSALSSTKHEAIAALRRGEPVIFPTETVYGLGVSVEAAASPDVLYDLKERDRGKPVSWLVGGADDLDRYGAHVPDLARRLARAYWPGPLTLIV